MAAKKASAGKKGSSPNVYKYFKKMWKRSFYVQTQK